MSQKTVVTLVDDLDGNEDDTVQTVSYAYDGVAYELDLGEHNRKVLDEMIQEYIVASRKIGKTTVGGTGRGVVRAATRSSGGGSGYSRDTLKEIRRWNQAQGNEVSERGRIPAAAIKAWEDAHQGNGSRLAAVGS